MNTGLASWHFMSTLGTSSAADHLTPSKNSRNAASRLLLPELLAPTIIV